MLPLGRGRTAALGTLRAWLGAMLLSWHNIQHYQDLMARMRSAIEAGAFADFEAGVVAGYARGDIDPL